MSPAVKRFLNRGISEVQYLCWYQLKATILQEEISVICGPNIFSIKAYQPLSSNHSDFSGLPHNEQQQKDENCTPFLSSQSKPPPQASHDASLAFPIRAKSSCSAAKAHPTWFVLPL